MQRQCLDDRSFLLLAFEQADYSHYCRLGIYSDLLFRRGVRHRLLIIPAREIKSPLGLKLGSFGRAVTSLVSWCQRTKRRILVRLFITFGRYDVVVLYRPFSLAGDGSPRILPIPAKRSRLVIDLDDSRLALASDGALRREIDAFLAAADAVIVSNSWILRCIPEVYQATIVTDAMDLVTYSPRHLLAETDRELVVGVLLPDQDAVAAFGSCLNVIHRLHGEIPFVLSILLGVGVSPPTLSGIVVRTSYLGAEERDAMSFFDLGLVIGGIGLNQPYVVNQEGRASHGLMRLMAMGIPCVICPGIVVDDIVLDNEEGMVVNTESEFEVALRHLLEDRTLRRSIGIKARERIVKKFAVEQVFRRWFNAVQGLVREEIVDVTPPLVSNR